MSCKKVNIYCEDDGYGVIVSTKFDKRNGEYLQYHYNDGYKIKKIFNITMPFQPWLCQIFPPYAPTMLEPK